MTWYLGCYLILVHVKIFFFKRYKPGGLDLSQKCGREFTKNIMEEAAFGLILEWHVK